MRYAQGDAELIGHLAEQAGFLRVSAAAYDEGDDAEAKRLAVVVRTLCHDTETSRALLAQLGLLDRVEFVDTTPEPEPEPETTIEDGEELRWVTFQFSLAPIAGGPRGFVAQLDRAHRSAPKPFDRWWNATVVQDGYRAFTRREIVLALANKDGGAHVDPTLPERYAAFARENSLGTVGYAEADGTEVTVDINPLLAMMRQIAYEVDETLKPIVGA